MGENQEGVIDSGTSLLVDMLEQRWLAYRNQLKRCRAEPSEEAIHDLRVANRRLLALTELLQGVSPHSRLKKLRRAFKKQLDGLDTLRDTQVMLVEVSETLSELPELASFQEYLAKREKRLLKSAAKAIKSYKTTSIRKQIKSTHKSLRKSGDESNRQAALLQVVDGTFKTTLRRFKRIEPARSASIHHVRVAFKKFRYMVEIVYPFAPNFPEKNFEIMHGYQTLMGNIQDLETFTTLFEKFADKNASYDPEPVRRFYQQRHTDAVHVFVEDMNQIHVFWRPEPDVPFPWETKQPRKKSASSRKPAKKLPEPEKVEGEEQVETEKETEK